MSIVKQIRSIMDKVTQAMSATIFAVLVVLVTYQVIVRYIFSNPSPWSEQAARYLLVWLILITSSYVFGRREHMNVDFFVGKLPLKINVAIKILTELLIGFFVVFVLIYGGYLAVNVALAASDLAMPWLNMGLVNSVIPISGGLTLIYTLFNILDHIQVLRTPKETQSNVETES